MLTWRPPDHTHPREPARATVAPSFRCAAERYGTSFLGPPLDASESDHTGLAAGALARPKRGAVAVNRRSGVVARMFCRRVLGDSGFPDGVVHVKLMAAPAAVPEVPAPRSAMYLPGLVGSGVLWLRACPEAQTLYDPSDCITLEAAGA